MIALMGRVKVGWGSSPVGQSIGLYRGWNRWIIHHGLKEPGFSWTVQFSHSVMSDSLWPHGLQQARLPCPSPSPGVCANSCPLSRWCQSTISSSVTPLSSCPQSFPASGSFQMSLRRVWRLFKKLKIELLYDLAIPPVDIKLDKTIILKNTWTSMFFVALFTILKI